MKKLLIILALAATVGGCAQLQMLSQGLSLATKSITNPVTKNDEAKVELAVDSAIELLQAYKKACAQGSADKNCKSNIAQIQAYTIKIVPLVGQLRTFVDSNDQINASVIYNQLLALYNSMKSVANTSGVNVGSLS